MSALPPGYRTTSAVGLTMLWRDSADGTSRCVTVTADTCPAWRLAEIAARDAAAHQRAPANPAPEMATHA